MVWSSDFDPIETEVYQKRLTRLTLFVLIVFGVLFLRLWFLQIKTELLLGWLRDREGGGC